MEHGSRGATYGAGGCQAATLTEHSKTYNDHFYQTISLTWK